MLASVEHTNIKREKQIAKITQNITFSDDSDVNVEDPITSGFMDRGHEAMIAMTNLTIGEFMEIYSDIEEKMNVVKRLSKSKISQRTVVL